MEDLIKDLAEWLEKFINEACDQECSHCGHFLEFPSQEDIERKLKGEQ